MYALAEAYCGCRIGTDHMISQEASHVFIDSRTWFGLLRLDHEFPFAIPFFLVILE